MKARYEIVVAGGGPVGACAAALLQRRARIAPGEVLLVDRRLPDLPAPAVPADAPPELRVSALSPGSLELVASVGARLDPARLAHYERMRVWAEGADPRGTTALCFDAAELAAPSLGAIVGNGALQAALLEAGRDAGCELQQAVVEGVRDDGRAIRLATSAGDVEAGLLVIADGAGSPLREMLGIGVEMRDYGQQAIVARLACERGHEDTAWQCFLPTGPVALLPLPGREVSLVWSATATRAAELLALAPAEFERELSAVMSPAVGALELRGDRASFPLRRQRAETWVRGACVLIGDAAHTIHPLAGQGLNQGLQDAAALARVLAARPPRESPAALRALRAWERERGTEYTAVSAVVDAFDRAFTGPLPMRAAGRAALAVAARSRLVRATFAREAML